MRTACMMALLLMLSGTAASAEEAPVPAAVSPAEPGSWEAIAGQVILHYVGGRTLEDAGGPSFNPFGIDGESLLFALGSFFVTADYDGRPVHEGEVAIFPQFATPRGGAFAPSAATPAIIPFAMLKSGTCYAGYVAGHPVADQIFAVDMTGQLCHAAAVDEIVHGYYEAVAAPTTEVAEEEGTFDPFNPTDADLDLAVWVAYGAAYAVATADPGFRFARDGDDATLRDAIVAALDGEGLGGVRVVSTTATSTPGPFGCAEPQSVELRVAVSPDGTGITLVAATARRMASYLYDPAVSEALDVRLARNCRTAGPGRVDAANEP